MNKPNGDNSSRAHAALIGRPSRRETVSCVNDGVERLKPFDKGKRLRTDFVVEIWELKDDLNASGSVTFAKNPANNVNSSKRERYE
jgi:hypothetical protein